MPDCNYCSESFADEEAYLDHLHEAHDAEELSRIDQRRVDQHRGEDDGGIPTGPLILGALLVFAGGVVVYVTMFMGGNGGGGAVDPSAAEQLPSNEGSVHIHGPITVTIDGQELDFGQSRFQNPREYPAFHFEGGDGSRWHGHAQGITLEYAMATLGIGVDRTSVTFEGRTYDKSDPDANVSIQVDGEEVNPVIYELEDGDRIEIVANFQDG